MDRDTAKGVQNRLHYHPQEAKEGEAYTDPPDNAVGDDAVELGQKGEFDDVESNTIKLDHDEKGQIEAVDLLWCELFDVSSQARCDFCSAEVSHRLLQITRGSESFRHTASRPCLIHAYHNMWLWRRPRP